MSYPAFSEFPPIPQRSAPEADFDSKMYALFQHFATTHRDELIALGQFLQENSTVIGGALNDTTIGLTTPAAGAFTSLDVSGRIEVGTGLSAGESRSISSGDITTRFFVDEAGTNARLWLTTDTIHPAFFMHRPASTGEMVRFAQGDPSVTVGSISVTSTTTSFNTASDYRLKENVLPIGGAIDRLKDLKPVSFAWKADGSRVDGFLAHEAQAVVPEAVTGEKDAVEAIGDITDGDGQVILAGVALPENLDPGLAWVETGQQPVYQGIDQAKLVPLLTAALQEALARIEALEASVATPSAGAA